MVQITIKNTAKKIFCNEGDNLYEILSRIGIFAAPCGGRGTCGKCSVLVNGEAKLSCKYEVRTNIIVELPEEQEPMVMTEDITYTIIPDIPKDGFGVAIDIGTTWISASFCNLKTGEILSNMGKENSQRFFGQDVMSRIAYAGLAEENLKFLQKAVVRDINALLGGFSKPVSYVAIAANTTMLHFLAGIEPHCLGQAPYSPAYSGELILPAEELGINTPSHTEIFCIPHISAFVGGDIAAGILATDLQNKAGNVLFIDIGTNGELVLAKGGKLTATSCATGSALEGMSISCGMTSASGAINSVKISNGKVNYTVIGGKPARGICGSGLLDCISELLKEEMLTENGLLGNSEFFIDQTQGISLNQHDINQVQLAKAAIRTGIELLLRNSNLQPNDIDEVIIAGGFGSHLSEASLINTGILLEKFRGKISYAGNTAKKGALLALLRQEKRECTKLIANSVENIDMAMSEDFQKLFLANMSFSKPPKL